jgi:hypothetical protein
MHRQHAHGEVDNGENTALLSAEEDSQDWRQLDTTVVKPGRTTTWWRIVRYGVLAVVILAGTAALTKTLFFGPAVLNHPNLLFHGSQLRSNGTHDFKRTVLMVSIDGLRCVHCSHRSSSI